MLGGFEGEGAWGVDCDILLRFVIVLENRIGIVGSDIVFAYPSMRKSSKELFKIVMFEAPNERHHQKAIQGQGFKSRGSAAFQFSVFTVSFIMQDKAEFG